MTPDLKQTNRAAKILLFYDICKTYAIILPKNEKYRAFSCTYQKNVVTLRPEIPNSLFITLYL